MLSISHAATGAFVASKFTHPLIYVPVAIALHFLEDFVPHWDAGSGYKKGQCNIKKVITLGVIDLVFAAVIVWWFWLSSYSLLDILTFKQPMAWHIMIGAVAGILPDLIAAPKNFLKLDIPFLDPINQFHERFHFSIPNKFWGLLPQVAVLTVIYFLR